MRGADVDVACGALSHARGRVDGRLDEGRAGMIPYASVLRTRYAMSRADRDDAGARCSRRGR
eukprot:1201643-Rhodomonas_salina.3